MINRLRREAKNTQRFLETAESPPKKGNKTTLTDTNGATEAPPVEPYQNPMINDTTFLDNNNGSLLKVVEPRTL